MKIFKNIINFFHHKHQWKYSYDAEDIRKINNDFKVDAQAFVSCDQCQQQLVLLRNEEGEEEWFNISDLIDLKETLREIWT